ncbi:uncharacterized protein LOC115777953 isoform X2 [Archocentrus centrarchus]|uniref:uncharacterized protein LOC115777953 isoform X2 n=1 Tax=Archocentrus centrarchus TaxID=63155 RepID=UPI0011E9D4B0|nr:uncharacterized protein LOC115777953 isoform X2 [Archocentrus centrarchus]
MKMLVVFVILLHVSQHALAVVVEVYEKERSVLLPCQSSGSMSDGPTVMWTRSDLDPKSVHLLREGGDDLRGQNQRYSGRTSVRSHALDSGDFSLTLREPQLTDSGSYTCSISAGRQEQRLTDIQLQVKDQYVEVKVEEGSESVILPCKTTPDLPEDTRVEWTRSDPEPVYRIQTKMNEDLLRTGDLSLTLKQPTERDTGGYICTIYRDKDILRQKLVLQVKEPFPFWAKALLVVLVLLVLLLVSGGLLYHFWHYFMTIPKVKVKSEVESVQLPLKTTVQLPEDAEVEWTDIIGREVHLYQNSSAQHEEQHRRYRERTEMNEDLLRTGDLSLTLKHPTDRDTYTYICTVYSEEGNILLRKEVELKVKVCKVDVKEGAESVQLPFKTTQTLPGDAAVQWERYQPIPIKWVHGYENRSDQPDKQNQVYRGRTEMNEDPLRTGDLSLTLMYPTDGDSGRYRCGVSLDNFQITVKSVLLKVKVCQVEVEEGAESVQLPFKTTENLPGDAEVQWWCVAPLKWVHVYKNSSDQPDKQHQDYRDRTKMNEDLLRTGDLSLTLDQPTERDSGEYRCGVYIAGDILRYKTVVLKVKGRAQVQDQTGIIRNRSSSIDPTPLMADQSV